MDLQLTGINMVIVTPSLKARNALIKAIEATSKIKPAMKSASESAQRAHYAPAMSKFIINTANPEMHEKLGFHAAVLAIEVDDCVEASNIAKTIFQQEGFQAEDHLHPEPEYPEGFITFVTSNALKGLALMFWPNKVPPDVAKMLPKREPWDD